MPLTPSSGALRLALAALAMVMLAGLAFELHWTRVEARGTALVAARHLGGYPRALADFRGVAAHQPGTDGLVDQGELLLFLGEGRSAAAVLGEAVAAEPRNALAWRLLAEASGREDPALAARASARFTALVPPLGARDRR